MNPVSFYICSFSPPRAHIFLQLIAGLPHLASSRKRFLFPSIYNSSPPLSTPFRSMWSVYAHCNEAKTRRKAQKSTRIPFHLVPFYFIFCRMMIGRKMKGNSSYHRTTILMRLKYSINKNEYKVFFNFLVSSVGCRNCSDEKKVSTDDKEN